MAIFMFIELSPKETLKEKLYDYRFRIRGAIKPPEDIVIAAIDEKSLGRLRRWPWSRDKITQLVKRLTEEEAEIVVVDIKFEDGSSGWKILPKRPGSPYGVSTRRNQNRTTGCGRQEGCCNEGGGDKNTAPFVLFTVDQPLIVGTILGPGGIG